MTKGLDKDGVYGKGKEGQEVRGWEKFEFSVQTWLPHFTDEKREAQGEETHPGSHRTTELELNPGLCSNHSSLHWSLSLSRPSFSCHGSWALALSHVDLGTIQKFLGKRSSPPDHDLLTKSLPNQQTKNSPQL